LITRQPALDFFLFKNWPVKQNGKAAALAAKYSVTVAVVMVVVVVVVADNIH